MFAAQGPAEAPDLNGPQHRCIGATTPTWVVCISCKVWSLTKGHWPFYSDLIPASFLHNYLPQYNAPALHKSG